MKFGILLFLSFYSHILFSQKNFIVGYIIKDKSDQIYGFTDIKDWKINPSEGKSLAETSKQKQVIFNRYKNYL